MNLEQLDLGFDFRPFVIERTDRGPIMKIDLERPDFGPRLRTNWLWSN